MLGLAAVEQVEGRAERAVQIATVANRLADEEGIVVVYAEGHPGEPYLEAARDALDETTASRAGARCVFAFTRVRLAAKSAERRRSTRARANGSR